MTPEQLLAEQFNERFVGSRLTGTEESTLADRLDTNRRAFVYFQALGTTKARSDEIARTYRNILRREPTNQEIDKLLRDYDAGADGRIVIKTIISSNEYFIKRGGDTLSGFIQAVYADLLLRAPTTREAAASARRLEHGGAAGRRELAASLLRSRELRALFAQGLYRGVTQELIPSNELRYALRVLLESRGFATTQARFLGTDANLANATRRSIVLSTTATDPTPTAASATTTTPTPIDAPKRQDRSSLVGRGVQASPIDSTLVLANPRTYTYTQAPATTYPDVGYNGYVGTLVDGAVGWTDNLAGDGSRYVGWSGGPITIDFDFGVDTSLLNVAVFANNSPTNTLAPNSSLRSTLYAGLQVEALTASGSTFVPLFSQPTSQTDINNISSHYFTYSLNPASPREEVTARYFRLIFTLQPDTFMHLAEIAFSAYPKLELTPSDPTPTSYAMTNGDAPFTDSLYLNGPGSTAGAQLSGGVGELTDSVLGQTDWSVNDFAEWVGWYGKNPTITFDFGAPMDFAGLRVFANNLGNDAGSGSTVGPVNVYRSLTAELSNDGVNYTSWFSENTSSNASTALWVEYGQTNFGGFRYVRLAFTASSATAWTLLSEVSFDAVPHRIVPASYSLNNGVVVNGSTAYTDSTYTGTGDRSTSFAPLSGGKGKLTDGSFLRSFDDPAILPPPSSSTWLAWTNQGGAQQVVTFDFGQMIDVSSISLLVNNRTPLSSLNPAPAAGAATLPYHIDLQFSASGNTFDREISYTVTREDLERRENLFDTYLIGSTSPDGGRLGERARFVRLTLTLLDQESKDGSSAFLMLGEVLFGGTTAVVTPQITPVTYAMPNGTVDGYLDGNYSPTNVSTTTPSTSLSGGLGKLTDGAVGVAFTRAGEASGTYVNDQLTPRQWVGWAAPASGQNPAAVPITFDFGAPKPLDGFSVNINATKTVVTDYNTSSIQIVMWLYSQVTLETSNDGVDFSPTAATPSFTFTTQADVAQTEPGWMGYQLNQFDSSGTPVGVNVRYARLTFSYNYTAQQLPAFPQRIALYLSEITFGELPAAAESSLAIKRVPGAEAVEPYAAVPYLNSRNDLRQSWIQGASGGVDYWSVNLRPGDVLSVVVDGVAGLPAGGSIQIQAKNPFGQFMSLSVPSDAPPSSFARQLGASVGLGGTYQISISASGVTSAPALNDPQTPPPGSSGLTYNVTFNTSPGPLTSLLGYLSEYENPLYNNSAYNVPTTSTVPATNPSQTVAIPTSANWPILPDDQNAAYATFFQIAAIGNARGNLTFQGFTDFRQVGSASLSSQMNWLAGAFAPFQTLTPGIGNPSVQGTLITTAYAQVSFLEESVWNAYANAFYADPVAYQSVHAILLSANDARANIAGSSTSLINQFTTFLTTNALGLFGDVNTIATSIEADLIAAGITQFQLSQSESTTSIWENVLNDVLDGIAVAAEAIAGTVGSVIGTAIGGPAGTVVGGLFGAAVGGVIATGVDVAKNQLDALLFPPTGSGPPAGTVFQTDLDLTTAASQFQDFSENLFTAVADDLLSASFASKVYSNFGLLETARMTFFDSMQAQTIQQQIASKNALNTAYSGKFYEATIPRLFSWSSQVLQPTTTTDNTQAGTVIADNTTVYFRGLHPTVGTFAAFDQFGDFADSSGVIYCYTHLFQPPDNCEIQLSNAFGSIAYRNAVQEMFVLQTGGSYTIPQYVWASGDNSAKYFFVPPPSYQNNVGEDGGGAGLSVTVGGRLNRFYTLSSATFVETGTGLSTRQNSEPNGDGVTDVNQCGQGYSVNDWGLFTASGIELPTSLAASIFGAASAQSYIPTLVASGNGAYLNFRLGAGGTATQAEAFLEWGRDVYNYNINAVSLLPADLSGNYVWGTMDNANENQAWQVSFTDFDQNLWQTTTLDCTPSSVPIDNN